MPLIDELHVHVGHIRGLASNLRRADLAWDEHARHQCAEQIESEVERICRLLEGSPAVGVPSTRQRNPISPAALLNGGIDRVRPSLAGRTVQVDIPTDLPSVEADAPAIEQVIAGLVQDAVGCTPENCRIKLSAEARGDFLRICLEHAGPWPLPQAREHLAISLACVEAHGGCMCTERRPEGGQRLIIMLPLLAPGSRA
jgi:K+-sensing histidine kinase KdpD